MAGWKFSVIDIDTSGKDRKLIIKALECLGVDRKFFNIYKNHPNAEGEHVYKKFSYDLSFGYESRDKQFEKIKKSNNYFSAITPDFAEVIFAVLNSLFGKTNICCSFISGTTNSGYVDESVSEYNADDKKIYRNSYSKSDDSMIELEEYCKENEIELPDQDEDEEAYWEECDGIRDSADFCDWVEEHSKSCSTDDIPDSAFQVSNEIKDILVENSTRLGYTELTAMILEKLR